MPRKPVVRETLEEDNPSDVQPKRQKKSKHVNLLTLRPNNKLTPELIADVRRQLRRGRSLGTILNKSLIPSGTFMEWRVKGEDYLTNEGPKEHALHGALVLAMRQALGARDAKIEDQIMDPGNPDHQQFLRIGERIIPQVWSRENQTGSEEALNPDDRFL